MKEFDFTELLNQEIKRLVSSEREHAGETSDEVHTMNLLFGSFFNEQELTKEHRDIMKSLQGLEVHTLLIDKWIDKPEEFNDKEIRTLVGFMIYFAMTEKFTGAMKKLKISSEKQVFALDKWNEALKNVYFGESLDVLYTKKEIIPFDLKEYIFMIRAITAKFIQLSLILGAMISGKTKEETEKIAEYGINLGIAFQIRDDYEDLENDILEGKQRAFVIKESLDLLNEKERKFILENFQKTPLECIKIIKNSKIPEFVKNVNHSFLDNALKNIESLNGRYVFRLKEIVKLLRI